MFFFVFFSVLKTKKCEADQLKAKQNENVNYHYLFYFLSKYWLHLDILVFKIKFVGKTSNEMLKITDVC